MGLLAYACLLIGAVVFVRNSAVDISGRAEVPVRVLAIGAGLGFGALGAFLLEGADGTGPGRVLSAMLVIGGMTYVWGVVRWRASGGLTVRRAGWLLVVAALALPSTLTLLLPLACLLLPTLREPEATRPGQRAHARRQDPASSTGS
jgi:hypothetical protein